MKNYEEERGKVPRALRQPYKVEKVITQYRAEVRDAMQFEFSLQRARGNVTINDLYMRMSTALKMFVSGGVRTTLLPFGH